MTTHGSRSPIIEVNEDSYRSVPSSTPASHPGVSEISLHVSLTIVLVESRGQSVDRVEKRTIEDRVPRKRQGRWIFGHPAGKGDSTTPERTLHSGQNIIYTLRYVSTVNPYLTTCRPARRSCRTTFPSLLFLSASRPPSIPFISLFSPLPATPIVVISSPFYNLLPPTILNTRRSV